MKPLVASLVMAIVVMMLSGCSWVRSTEEGAQVRIVTAAEVADCDSAGITHVSVMDRLGVVQRDRARVSEELQTLARNSAAQLGGDTVVATTQITEGTQTFAVYKCDH